MDEKPPREYNDWVKERCQFYMRLEPNEPVTDVDPDLPRVPNTHRVRVEGALSTEVWKIL